MGGVEEKCEARRKYLEAAEGGEGGISNSSGSHPLPCEPVKCVPWVSPSLKAEKDEGSGS